MFGPKRHEVTGEWRKLHNEELYDLYIKVRGVHIVVLVINTANNWSVKIQLIRAY
jgi:hypothetical protein